MQATALNTSTSLQGIIKQNDPRAPPLFNRRVSGSECSGELTHSQQVVAEHGTDRVRVMGMADADKRINLAAPLISVRRHGGDGTGPAATAAGLPAYRAYATSGAQGYAGAGGAVPFGWEHRPGHPKSVRTRRAPPSTIADAPPRVTRKPAAAIAASERARDEERSFSDALSRDDVSCVTANCSATGLSDAASAGAGARAAPGARGSVMMDRFLPAAHAVAAGSPQTTFRKAGSARDPTTRSPAVPSSARTGGGGGRLPAQRRLPVQHIAAYRLPPLPPEGSKNEDGGGDDDAAGSDAHSTAGFAPRRCGLLPGRCLESARLLSRGARRGAGRPFLSGGGGSRRATDPLLRRSRNGQQQPQHTGDDPGTQSWEEVYIKSLLRSGGGGGSGLMGPAAAVVSELDRTVRELYRHRGGKAVKPKASHLGLLLVLDRSNEDSGRGYHGSAARKLSRAGDAAPLLPATTRSSPSAGNKLGSGVADDAGGKYGFPLLLEDAAAVAGREMVLSPQPLLSLPLPKSPSESWLSLALPSVSMRPPPAVRLI